MGTLEMSEAVAEGITSSALAMPGVTVLVGHAGVGKTNLALNLALAQARAGIPVTLADLDLVNPYFRSSDYAEALEAAGVRLIAPLFARTALDTPSMGGELDGAIEAAGATGTAGARPSSQAAGGTIVPAGHPGDGPSAPMDATIGPGTPSPAPRLIIDVGGDDLGATALGRYARALKAAGARLLYAINAFRTLTATPQEAVEVLRAVEGSARLQACGVVNCSNLADQTSAADVEQGRVFAHAVADLADLPLVATIVPAALADELAASPGAPVATHARPAGAPTGSAAASPNAPTPANPAAVSPAVVSPASAQAGSASAGHAGVAGPAATPARDAVLHEPLIFVERFVRPPWE